VSAGYSFSAWGAECLVSRCLSPVSSSCSAPGFATLPVAFPRHRVFLSFVPLLLCRCCLPSLFWCFSLSAVPCLPFVVLRPSAVVAPSLLPRCFVLSSRPPRPQTEETPHHTGTVCFVHFWFASPGGVLQLRVPADSLPAGVLAGWRWCSFPASAPLLPGGLAPTLVCSPSVRAGLPPSLGLSSHYLPAPGCAKRSTRAFSSSSMVCVPLGSFPLLWSFCRGLLCLLIFLSLWPCLLPGGYYVSAVTKLHCGAGTPR